MQRKSIKKKIKGLLAGSILLVACSALGESKIGVIDIDKILSSSKELPKTQAKLERKFSEKHDRIVSLQDKLKQEEETYHREAATMKTGEKEALALKIDEDRKKLQIEETRFEEEFVKARNEALQEILDKVKTAVDRFAEREHYDFILNRTNTPFALPKYDVTSAIIKQMEK